MAISSIRRNTRSACSPARIVGRPPSDALTKQRGDRSGIEGSETHCVDRVIRVRWPVIMAAVDARYQLTPQFSCGAAPPRRRAPSLSIGSPGAPPDARRAVSCNATLDSAHADLRVSGRTEDLAILHSVSKGLAMCARERPPGHRLGNDL